MKSRQLAISLITGGQGVIATLTAYGGESHA